MTGVNVGIHQIQECTRRNALPGMEQEDKGGEESVSQSANEVSPQERTNDSRTTKQSVLT
jgi:hypothetical protein